MHIWTSVILLALIFFHSSDINADLQGLFGVNWIFLSLGVCECVGLQHPAPYVWMDITSQLVASDCEAWMQQLVPSC